ncbi:MAG: four helix bundle protein [Pyrinomonadaceae bacterium]
MQLVKGIYLLTREFPSDERFGLISQMRRAAVWVPSNIAEGQARHSTGEFIQFVSHAEGSVAELETQLTIAVDLSYCDEQTAKPLFDLLLELRKMLNALRRKLQGR